MSWDVIGHEWAAEILKQHVAQHSQRHAYLFSGPPAVGRRTLALRFAQALNCPQPPAPGEPCRTCRVCRQIERMQHPDLLLVQAEQEGKDLKVDSIRTLQHHLSLSPYEANFRVALLLRFQEANANAANALLKTLEEAPSQAILLLTADTPEGLLPTIVSRCEVLRLRPMRLQDLEAHLHDHRGIETGQARLLAHLSSGRLGFALRMHANPGLLERRQEWLNDLRRMLDSPHRTRFVYAERICRDKENFRQALLVWLSYWRDVFLCAARAGTPLVNLDREPELREVANWVDLPYARALVGETEKALARLEANINPRLLAEVLLLGWPRMSV